MARLEAAIAAKGDHLDTGLTGNYFMTKLFTESGRNDLMFRITNQTTFPSYGFFLSQGYTTWPETWNVKPCCGDTVSKMHGCYNAVGLWFVQGVAGISVDASAEDDFTLTVRAGVDAGDIHWARGSRAALQGGEVVSSWALADGGGGAFSHNVTVPLNAVAKVMIPARTTAEVLESGQAAASAPGVSVLGPASVNGIPFVSLQVGSGRYAFTSSWRRGRK